jgi:hypothetical protein
MSMYILVAIVFGVVSAMIASAKARNVFGWFAAGLLIGPFALVVLALPARTKNGRFAECPACCEVVRSDATVCRHCGTAFEV